MSPSGNSASLPVQYLAASPSSHHQPSDQGGYQERSSHARDSPTTSPAFQNPQFDWVAPSTAAEDSPLPPSPLKPRSFSRDSQCVYPGEPRTPDSSGDQRLFANPEPQESTGLERSRIRVSKSEYDLFEFYREHAGVWVWAFSTHWL